MAILFEMYMYSKDNPRSNHFYCLPNKVFFLMNQIPSVSKTGALSPLSGFLQEEKTLFFTRGHLSSLGVQHKNSQ